MASLITHFTHLTHFTSLHSLTFFSQPACGLGLRQLGLSVCRRWRSLRADMASGGEGFGTERARLAGDGLSTERARLAQGGYCEKALAQNVQD